AVIGADPDAHQGAGLIRHDASTNGLPDPESRAVAASPPYVRPNGAVSTVRWNSSRAIATLRCPRGVQWQSLGRWSSTFNIPERGRNGTPRPSQISRTRRSGSPGSKA